MAFRGELWTFCKAQLTAQAASVVDFAVTLLLAEGCGLWYLYSSFLGALSGGVANCAMNYRWVFDSEGLKKRGVAMKYLIVWTGSILLNTSGTYALTELSGQYFVYAKVIVAIAVGFFWNYQLQRLFVYRQTHLTDRLRRKKTNHNIEQ